MKIKNGRVRIECEKDRPKISKAEFLEFLARENKVKKKTAKKGKNASAPASQGKMAH